MGFPSAVEIASSHLRLALLPDFGCHWVRLAVRAGGNWVEPLHGPPDEISLRKRPLFFGSYLLAPWSNRIAGAAFAHGGRLHRLRPNFEDGTAIHGDLVGRPFRTVEASEDRFEAVLDSEDFPDFNYPFPLRFRHRVEVRDRVLAARLEIENFGEEPVPVGMGFHPYFRRRLTPGGEEAKLRVPAQTRYPLERGLARGAPIPVFGKWDLQEERPLGNPDLDDCYTSLSEPFLSIRWPGVLRLRLGVAPPFTHIVVCVPNLPDGAPKDHFAVEPVTHENDGFNRRGRGEPGGTRLLAPGERWGGEVQFHFEEDTAVGGGECGRFGKQTGSSEF